MANDAIPLREHFDLRLIEMDKRIEQRFEASEKAVAAALAAAKEAVGKAEIAAEKRFDSVNEFRQTLTDQNATFARREMVDEKIAGLDAKISSLSVNGSENKGKSAGLNAAWGYLLGFVGLVSLALAVFQKT